MSSSINQREVTEVFIYCLFKQEEVVENQLPENHVMAQGLAMKVAFNADRLNASREAVRGFLSHVNPIFHIVGAPFTDFCVDDTDSLWTGSHSVCDQLIMLGVGLGYVTVTQTDDLPIIQVSLGETS